MDSMDEKHEFTSGEAFTAATHHGQSHDIEKSEVAVASPGLELEELRLEEIAVGPSEVTAFDTEKSTISVKKERIYMAVLCWCMFL